MSKCPAQMKNGDRKPLVSLRIMNSHVLLLGTVFKCMLGQSRKVFYSFKKRYSISNMGLIGYNKRFLATTVNTPSSTHDPRLLKHTEVFQGISNDNILPNKSIKLGVKFGEILLVTVFA